MSGANDLFNNINVQSIWRNKSVSGATLQSLKSEDGMGPGIQRLAYEIDNTFTGGPLEENAGPPLFPNLERSGFYNDYPAFDDENNLSLVAFFKCRGIGVMFTGDLEKAGFKALLKNTSFTTALRQTNVYIAPHHGRESGCSEEVAELLTDVFYVVISDKGYAYETQETVPFYRRIEKGGPFRGETRHVLTTRRDGRIGFNFNPTGWGPY